jgi:alpha-tubulin suppressor-like RCC1 family protein
VSTEADAVFVFGRGDFGQLGLGDTHDRLTPTLCEGLAGLGIASLACGQYHSLVALRGGGVMSFGRNGEGYEH